MNEKVISERPWLKGAMELLEHAIYHYRLGSATDFRFAMIHVDNSVELAGRLYLKMEVRIQDSLPPNEVKEVERYFDKLLKHLSSQLALDNLTKSSIEYFHNIRNNLYHNGNGISVDPTIVVAYITTAIRLLDQMYGLKVAFPEQMQEAELVDSIVSTSERITESSYDTPEELVSSYKSQSLGIKIAKELKEALSLMYLNTGYHAERQPTLLIDKRRIRPDLICRKDRETVVVEIRDLISTNSAKLDDLLYQKQILEKALAVRKESTLKFRVHVISHMEKKPIINTLQQAGWEVVDWETTLHMLSQNGLTDRANALKKMMGDYIALSKREEYVP